jgi:hypothetical protein
MLKYFFVRSLAASLCAWLLVLCGMAAIWTVDKLDIQMLVDASIVTVTFGSVIYGGWWFVDAILLRPLLLPRIGWIGLAPIESISLCIYRCLTRWHAIVEVGGLPMIVHVAKEMLVFYAGYLTVSVLLLWLLSRLAHRKTSSPAN